MKWILILSILLTTKCKQKTDIKEAKSTNLTELNSLHNIKIFNGKEVSKYNLTINFNSETNQVSGFSGCNRYFGSYSLEKNILKFGPLASTKMMCRGEGQSIETNFLKTLSQVNKVEVGENYIQLFNGNTLLFAAIKDIVNNALIVEYTSSSRGAYKSIIIRDQYVLVSRKKGAKGIKEACDKTKWEALQPLIEAINLDSISSLNPPSKAHQFDRVPLAHLKIVKDDKNYESVAFDHGNPPKEIEALVKEILSIAQNIE